MTLSIGKQIQQAVESDDAYSHFKYFEPWDVGFRSEEIFKLAEEDDVDLFADDYIATGNIAPHPFQSGFLFSCKKIRALIGPSQGGKSYPALIEIGIMCSGELPISLQHNKGADTGIKRMVNKLNVRRWGRFDKETGEFIDHDTDVPDDGTWDCGNIIGAGKYPKEKIIPKRIVDEKVERTIWIGTTKKALDEAWWPKLTGGNIFPEKFIDRSKGNKGTIQSDGQHIINLINDVRLSIISYESGFRSFEAVTVWACFFDEESVKQDCWTAAFKHCKYLATQMTPYNQMTYTRDILFRPSAMVDVFHAVAYDSPYLDRADIDYSRENDPEHEIKARIWAEHSSEMKAPYYRQDKLRSWIDQIKKDGVEYPRAVFVPSEDYFGIKKVSHSSLPGLMNVSASMYPVEADDSGGKTDAGHNIAWTIFEDLRQDCAYYIIVDSANGADVPEDALDFQAAIVFRPPIHKDELYPVPVAEIESTSRPEVFAKTIGPALLYYNIATLGAESSNRGAGNGMFYSEMREYPYWIEKTYMKSGTNKFSTNKGIDNHVGTRKLFFDEIEKVFGSFTVDEFPPIPSIGILEQAKECVKVVKNGNIRPDHPSGKTNDLLLAYGIGLFTWKHFSEQIKCRRKKKENLAKAPRDSVIGLLEARRASEYKADQHFPSNIGARR